METSVVSYPWVDLNGFNVNFGTVNHKSSLKLHHALYE